MGDNNNEDICMICLEKKTNPQILRCKHTFCDVCISQLTMHSRFYLHGPKCPLCRSTLEDKPQQSVARGLRSGHLTNLRDLNARVRNSDICVERAIRELRRVWYDLSSDTEEDDINIKMPRRRTLDVVTQRISHGKSCSTAQFQNVQQETATDLRITNDSSSPNQLQDTNFVENVHVDDDTCYVAGTSDELLKQIAQDIAAQGTSHGGSLSTAQLTSDEQQLQIDLSVDSVNVNEINITDGSSSLNQFQETNTFIEVLHVAGNTTNINHDIPARLDEPLEQNTQDVAAQRTIHGELLSVAQLNNDEQQSKIDLSFKNGDNCEENLPQEANNLNDNFYIIDDTMDSTAYIIRGSDAHFPSIDNENLNFNSDTSNSAVLEVEFITDVNASEELVDVSSTNNEEKI